jgi:thiol-disulfide isomerase/thioredoxin
MSRAVIALALFACQACQAGQPASSESARRGLELVESPATADVAGYVASQVARGDATIVVYVGASWCEPCRRFHEAAAAHQLDAAFGGLRLLAFDADRDAQALDAAGYRSEMVPLFALPGRDGRATGKQFEGSIKGAGAVAEIAPHLRGLVGR